MRLPITADHEDRGALRGLDDGRLRNRQNTPERLECDMDTDELARPPSRFNFLSIIADPSALPGAIEKRAELARIAATPLGPLATT